MVNAPALSRADCFRPSGGRILGTNKVTVKFKIQTSWEIENDPSFPASTTIDDPRPPTMIIISFGDGEEGLTARV